MLSFLNKIMKVLNKLCVLELNKNWFPISLKTPKKVFENFSTGNFMGLHMDWSEEDLKNEDYSNPTELIPLNWEDWIKLPVRDFDLSIRTPSMEIRVPNIVICSVYDKLPTTEPKYSKKNIFLRDGNVCQYSGIQYPSSELNVDHVIPKSRGGTNDWENLVTCHKPINFRKGDKTPQEAGLSLIRKPKKPTASSLFFAQRVKDPKWEMFMKHLN